MPYYIYRISSTSAPQNRRLKLCHTFDTFKSAKNKVRAMRSELDPTDSSILKIVFAENPTEAQQRLSEVREKPILKEWEK